VEGGPSPGSTECEIVSRASGECDRRSSEQLAPARHFRESQALSIAQVAERLGRSPATVNACFYDPRGAEAREVKARYRGTCRGCGAPTSARNGKGDAYEYCKQCHPGAIAREWTRERVLAAMRAWHARCGSPPTSYDWSVSHASRRGPEAHDRLQDGSWPAPSTVSELYGTWLSSVMRRESM
jgi:hypothetical protein